MVYIPFLLGALDLKKKIEPKNSVNHENGPKDQNQGRYQSYNQTKYQSYNQIKYI